MRFRVIKKPFYKTWVVQTKKWWQRKWVTQDTFYGDAGEAIAFQYAAELKNPIITEV